MPYDDLADFLGSLEHAGELARVSVPVNPALEIAEITSRIAHAPGGGPAVLFEDVRGGACPVVTNLLGSERRLSLALRCESLADAESRIERLLNPPLELLEKGTEGWLGSLKLLPHLAQLTRLPPKTVKTGRSQQVVRMGRDIDLRELPAPQSWPRETLPVITAGQVVTQHPETGERHVSCCPLTVRGQETLGVHWTAQDAACAHYQGYAAENRQMPLAVVLGGDPLLRLLASLPLPKQTDAWLLAGFLRDRNVELVKARTLDLDVPAGADVVIEGRIDTEASAEPSRPIALDTGYYSGEQAVPLMQATAVTHRSNPVMPAVIPGPPPTEQSWLDRAAERLQRPIVRLFLPEIVDLHRPPEGAGRNFLFVSIRKEHPHQARKVMNALWGMTGFATTKWIVVVDADVDVRDPQAVWFHVGANAHPGRDLQNCAGPTYDADHAAPIMGMGHKLGIDATKKLPAEGHPREWPEPLEMSRQMRELVEERWGEYGFGES